MAMHLSRRSFGGLLLATAATAPREGRAAADLVVGVPDNLTGLDPADLNDNLSQSSARLMHEGLYILDRDMKLVPALAESHEANETATEFVFHLRKGVTFHDGTPFNAEAVKFSYDRAGNPANHLKRQSLFVMIDHTDVMDEYTVRVVLKYPFGAFANDIAHPGAMIVSPTAVQKYGKDFTRHPCGTGPYAFVSWSADTLRLQKNANYWKPGLPKIDSITLRSVPENGARIAMLKAGEAQFIYPVPPEMMQSLQANPDIALFDEPSILTRFVALNNLRKPFSDVRVRRALNYAIDKEAFARVVYSGHADPMDSPMPPKMAFYAKQGAWPYDPAKAKALLAEAGYPNGFEFEHDRRFQYAGRARHAVRAAAACGGRGADRAAAAGCGGADGESVQRAEAGGRDGGDGLHRMVILDRGCGLGAAADPVHKIVSAGSVEPGMVQQSGGGCGHRGWFEHDGYEGPRRGLCQGAIGGVGGGTLDCAGGGA